jgi:hypothetical protein
MDKKLEAYRTLILTDDKAMNAFLKDPAGELKKHTDKVLNAKQGAAVKHFFDGGTEVAKAFPDKAGQVGKAPRWLHELVDWLWDKFF